MRPDEHKKKRSAQYKKKHGLNEKHGSGKTRELHEAIPKGGKEKPEKLEDGKKEQSSVRQAVQSSADGTTYPGSEDYRPSFSRRKVESNWSRYEDTCLPETEGSTDKMRGEDFQTLLGVASDSFSQFRFQEEKDWETDTETTSPMYAAFLAVDTVDLAAAMQCVPLHKRLGIEESIFGNELIESFFKEAKENSSKYQSKGEFLTSKEVSPVAEKKNCIHPENVFVWDNENASSVQSDGSNGNSDDILDDILDMAEQVLIPDGEKSNQCSLPVSNGSKSTMPSPQVSVNTATVDTTIKTNKLTPDQSVKNNVPVQAQTESICEEDDLEILLGIGDVNLSAHTASIVMDETQPVQVSQANFPSKDETSGTDMTAKVKSEGVKPQSTSLADNLDDWLDSVLDD